MKQPSIEAAYRRLVRTRKADLSLAKHKLINPSETRFDCHHPGSYAQWAGDLPFYKRLWAFVSILYYI